MTEEKGRPIDEKTLVEAIRAGDVLLARSLFENGMAVFHGNENAASHIVHAVESRSIPMVHLVLNQGGWACGFNNEPIKKALCYPFTRDGKPQFDLAEVLIQRGASINWEHNAMLVHACVHGKFDVVKFLIAHGADVAARNYQPFIEACASGRKNTVQFMMGKYDVPFDRSEQGLIAACMREHYDVANMIIDGCAYAGLQTKLYETGKWLKDRNEQKPHPGSDVKTFCPFSLKPELVQNMENEAYDKWVKEGYPPHPRWEAPFSIIEGKSERRRL